MPETWQDLDEFEPASRRELLDKVRAFVASHPIATLDHEPDWINALAADAGKAARCFVCMSEAGDVVGYAPFLVHPSELTVEASHFTVFGYRIRRFCLSAGPLFAASGAADATLTAGLFSRISATLGPRELPFCLGMDVDSSFAAALGTGASRWGFFLMPRGPTYKRRLIALPASFDEYMAGLGSKTRQDLRRQERRLQKEAGKVTSRRYCTEDEVSEFLDLAERVSRRTYQWNLLHMGVRDTTETQSTLAVAARHGWMRCYVLFGGDGPIAFMLGYLHRRTYYSLDIGYDPRWSEWSPGNVLHMHVVRDLVEADPKADYFDFMYGDNSNKERLSNRSRNERNIYIVPATVRWRLVAGILASLNAALECLGRFLERYGIKSRIKRYWRRGAVKVT